MGTILLVTAALVGAGAVLRRRGSTTAPVSSHTLVSGRPRSTAELLDERFARGELDEREYLRLRTAVTPPGVAAALEAPRDGAPDDLPPAAHDRRTPPVDAAPAPAVQDRREPVGV